MDPKVGPRGRILLVDDDDSCRETLAAMLETEHDVTQARSFTTALHPLRSGNFEVLLTDFQLQDGTGYELLKLSRHPHLVAILVTGMQGTEVTEAAKDSRVFRVAFKPFDTAMVLGWVTSAVQLSRGRASGTMRKIR